MRGVLALLLLTGVAATLPATASAQVPGDAGTDVEAAQAEVDRDYAQALAGDCATACRALESMRRATDRLCALNPGDRCARAKQKVDDATARVRLACPTCADALKETLEEKSATAPAPADAPVTTNAVEAESVRGKRGCAGCATASRPDDAAAPLLLAGLALLVVRRRRRSS